MSPSKNCLDFIKKYESLELEAYPDPGTGNEPWTIGYGTTRYRDGSKVKRGDTITRDLAESLLVGDVERRSNAINGLIKSVINQRQYDALVSFVYNCGVGALQKSTLLKKVNIDPKDISIRDEFMKWNKASGKPLAGLTKRRKAEADMYFKT